MDELTSHVTLPPLSSNCLQSGSAKWKPHSSDKRYGGSSSPRPESGKIALRLSFPDGGIAVNSWNVLVKINNTRAALGVPLHFPSNFFLFFFFLTLVGPGTVEIANIVVGGWLAGWLTGQKVNQSNVSSRSRARSPSPQSARVFQTPSAEHMCSR